MSIENWPIRQTIVLFFISNIFRRYIRIVLTKEKKKKNGKYTQKKIFVCVCVFNNKKNNHRSCFECTNDNMYIQ